MDPWAVVSALAGVAAAAVAAAAAWLSRLSAKEANAAAKILAGIERDRRHSELSPRFEFEASPYNPGSDVLKLRVNLVGPPGLDRVDSLTVSIRDDDYRRGETGLIPGGATEDEIKRQIWGPYRFTPGTSPYGEAPADLDGRSSPYDEVLPVGEHLDFTLEPTQPPKWSPWTSTQWAADRGSCIRLKLIAHHQEFGTWTIREFVDVASMK